MVVRGRGGVVMGRSKCCHGYVEEVARVGYGLSGLWERWLSWVWEGYPW